MARARIEKHGAAPPKLDARELVQAEADAVAEHLRRSLVEGVSPVDGSARPRKANGKPQGFETGTLARGIQVTKVTGSQEKATATITTPSSRHPFLDRHTDILTLEGRADEVRREAADKYLRETNGHE